MTLTINFDTKHYKQDVIDNGRAVEEFFEVLSRNIFNQSFTYWKKHKELTSDDDLPILSGERNIYSTIAVAVNNLTPVHMSEYPFNRKEYCQLVTSRRVDIWCLHKFDHQDTAINYFIEVKKGEYNLNKASLQRFEKGLSNDIQTLVEQMRSLKQINPQWGTDNAFLGLIIIHGHYQEDNDVYNEDHIRDNIAKQLDRRSGAQLLTSTWTLPKEMTFPNDDVKYKFVCIAGIVVTKKVTA